MEPGVVRITLADVYGEMVGMKDDFTEVKALLQSHIALEEQRNQGIEVRLENHGTRLGDLGSQATSLDGRMTTAEADIRQIREDSNRRDARKAPWWSVVGAVVGIITVPGAIIAFLIALSNFTATLSRIVGN
jgi:hypothetical protein